MAHAGGRRGKGKLPDDPRLYFVTHDEDLTLDDVAAAYKGRPGCSIATLKRRSSAEKWKDQRSEHRRKVAEKVDELEALGERAEAARDTRRDTDPRLGITGASSDGEDAPEGAVGDAGRARSDTRPAGADTGHGAAASFVRYRAAQLAAEELIADEQARTVAEDLRLRARARQNALRAVTVGIDDAMAFALAHRTRLRLEKTPDGTVEGVAEHDEELTVHLDLKATAQQMVSRAWQTFRSIENSDLLGHVNAQRLGLERLQAEVEMLRAEVRERTGDEGREGVEVRVRFWEPEPAPVINPEADSPGDGET